MAARRSSSSRKRSNTVENERAGADRARRAAAQVLPPEPVCPALVVSVGQFTDDDAEALALAEEVVRRTLSGDWRVSALGPGARDYRVSPASGRRIPVGQAWVLIGRLRRDRDVFDAEPELREPGLEPPPVTRATTEGRPVPASGGDDKHLPCTDPDRFAWSLELCRVPDAWQLTPPVGGRQFGEGIRVGHPDTGYTRHPEIFDPSPAGNRIRWQDGRDFVGGDTDALDPLGYDGNPGHGTATSSVIMAGADFNAGPRVDGVAPRAELIPLRVTESVVIWDFAPVVEAIHWAVAMGCHVISMSLGGVRESRTLHRAIRRAIDNDIIVLAAAGNVWPWVVYPAKFDEVVAVAACNCRRRTWRSSASGPAVDVTAPGESVWVARAKKGTPDPAFLRDRGSGTSFAVATTAGACALWLAFHGRSALIARYGAGRLASIFKELLLTQGVTTPPGWDRKNFGAGILDVRRLLEAPLPETPHAAGMRVRASAAPARVDLVDEIATYFPGLPRPRVRVGLARFLGVTEAELRELLAEHGDEVLFHVATNPEVRARISGGRARTGRARAGTAAQPPGAAQFHRTASPAVRRRAAL
jgi:serine protease